MLLHDKNLPRGIWKTARITELIVSNDGKVRSAEIVLANGVRLRRPINLLVPLEVEEPYETDDDAAAAANPNDAPGPSSADDDFLGFTEYDMQRAADALARLDDEPDEAALADAGDPGADSE